MLGELVTEPLPTVVTVNVYVAGGGGWDGFCVKVAVTAVLEFTVTEAGLVEPVNPPLHPVKDQPAAGVAVTWTTAPEV